MKLITVQYALEKIPTWDHYRAKLARLLDDACKEKPHIVLLPEYASWEIVDLFPELYPRDEEQIAAIQKLLPDYLDLFGDLSRKHRCYICAGTFLTKEGGTYKNRAFFFAPDGSHQYQDKIQLTPFEKTLSNVSPGSEIKIFETEHGRVGITVCYDSEFPLIARKQVEAGALLLLTPSCTSSREGFYRVHIASRCRAMENQCYVVQSSLVGEAPWANMFSFGCGGAYTPVDAGFPEDGIQVLGPWNQPGFLTAYFDLKALEKVRRDGQVHNHHDWELLPPVLKREVRVIKM